MKKQAKSKNAMQMKDMDEAQQKIQSLKLETQNINDNIKMKQDVQKIPTTKYQKTAITKSKLDINKTKTPPTQTKQTKNSTTNKTGTKQSGQSTITYKNNIHIQNPNSQAKIVINQKSQPQSQSSHSEKKLMSTNDRSEHLDFENEQDEDQTIYDDTLKQFGQEHKVHSEQQRDWHHNKPLIINKIQSCEQISSSFQELIKSVQQKLIKIIPNQQIDNLGDIIGEGGFGQVYKGKWMNMEVAIKEMILSYSEFKTMDREMSLMAQNRHQKLVNMYGIVLNEIRKDRLQCCIIMELMQQDLEDYIFQDQIKNDNPDKLSEKIDILLDVTEGIYFLHLSEVVHRDIKPKNILLNDKKQAKLTDLGIARALEDKEKTMNATIAFTARYASRESAVDEVTAYTSDIWSLGLVMYELFTHKRCWDGLSSNKIIIGLSKQASPFEKDWEKSIQNQDLVKLITQCCDYVPENRPTPQYILDQLKKIKSNIK
ncbi:Protein kinase-like domain [Pseudocohnilembus persalinus]|uniref:Protein kinase-like domain n=1 Tax=Pseudocohnilembus persalinus TaxID=266149 RepID=A0A0V0QD70_PSEPJ|nr:Protein kinase-like domain [Pseudocohnilembus persalinus]|eukprot:KRX00145.1 Protein kinase-like domain [Pseudocohnilembus persalinus]